MDGSANLSHQVMRLDPAPLPQPLGPDQHHGLLVHPAQLHVLRQVAQHHVIQLHDLTQHVRSVAK